MIVEDQWSLLWNAVDHTWSVLITASYREPYCNCLDVSADKCRRHLDTSFVFSKGENKKFINFWTWTQPTSLDWYINKSWASMYRIVLMFSFIRPSCLGSHFGLEFAPSHVIKLLECDWSSSITEKSRETHYPQASTLPTDKHTIHRETHYPRRTC